MIVLLLSHNSRCFLKMYLKVNKSIFCVCLPFQEFTDTVKARSQSVAQELILKTRWWGMSHTSWEHVWGAESNLWKKLKLRWQVEVAHFKVGHTLNIPWQGNANLEALLNKLPLSNITALDKSETFPWSSDSTLFVLSPHFSL